MQIGRIQFSGVREIKKRRDHEETARTYIIDYILDEINAGMEHMDKLDRIVNSQLRVHDFVQFIYMFHTYIYFI